MTITRSCLFSALFALGFMAQAGEFTYRAPPGWKVLMENGQPTGESTSGVSPSLVSDVKGHNYAIFAIDPLTNDTDKIGASFNAIEANTTGHLTDHDAKNLVTMTVVELTNLRITVRVLSSGIRKVNGADVGVNSYEITAPDGKRRMLQYVMPGRKTGTMLSYQASKDDFDKLLPAFEASAAATKGIYDPGVFHWDQFLLSGGFGAAAAGAIGSAIAYFRRRRYAAEIAAEQAEAAEGAPAPAAEGGPPPADVQAPVKAPSRAKGPVRKPSKHVWYCDECGNPVPIRLDQCRCGGKKPA